MKTNKLMAVVAAVALGSVAASAQTSTNFTFNVGLAVPDGSAIGLTAATNLTLPGATSISSVTVGLDITGGFNGDLYAYLVGPTGGFTVLLNRPGVTTGNSFGYSDTGLNVTFDDTAANSIHFYQADSPTINGSGQLTLTWQPDGENIDPQSDPALFPAAQSAMLNSFIGMDPNGTWTLFMADFSSGGQSTLANWSLNFTDNSRTVVAGVDRNGFGWGISAHSPAKSARLKTRPISDSQLRQPTLSAAKLRHLLFRHRTRPWRNCGRPPPAKPESEMVPAVFCSRHRPPAGVP